MKPKSYSRSPIPSSLPSVNNAAPPNSSSNLTITPNPSFPSLYPPPLSPIPAICTLKTAFSLISFRPYQRAAFENRSNGLEVWLWGRQTGKSFTLAAWAVDRLLSRPGRTVTILSNSKFNGMELNRRCAEVCHLMGQAFEQVDLSPDHRFDTMNCETRITLAGKAGRIIVLPANPRTARGFSGDVIFDEFGFQENSSAIWEAAEPILAANPDFLGRIASSANGKHNMFYRLATDPNIPLRRVTRTDAYLQGCPVFHPITREPITPAEARALASNKRAYDQNYECAFEDENMALLTYELISAAERPNLAVICEQDWTPEALAFLGSAPVSGAPFGVSPNDPFISEIRTPSTVPSALFATPTSPVHTVANPLIPLIRNPHSEIRHLYAGLDVGRHRDRTVLTLLEQSGASYLVRAILRMDGLRLPDQQRRLEPILSLPNLKLMKIDMTGLGLGLFEYTQEKFGRRVVGVNFSSTIPLHSLSPSCSIRNPPSEFRNQTVRVPEALALQLLQAFEDRAIQCPADLELRDDLRKPERLISPSGRVSIAATRDESGHADHFWSLALALDAAQTPNRSQPPTQLKSIERRWTRPFFNGRKNGVSI